MPYVVSLIYLALCGSVIAFGAYLTLLGRIGADRAGYATVLFPLVALAISTVVEGYVWPPAAILGLALLLAGNLLVLLPARRPLPQSPTYHSAPYPDPPSGAPPEAPRLVSAASPL